MRITYILINIVFLFSNCFEMPENPIKKKDNRNAIEKYWYSGGIGLCLSIRSDEIRNEIVDNRDGTISLVTNTYSKYDACPWEWGKPAQKNGNGILLYVIKKCIQGQVYRQAQNDCKGAGTAANYWNAQKLQACPTNNSCSDSISPTMSSCANDTTSGKTWKPGNFQTGNSINTVREYLKSRTDEIPSGSTDYYWSDSSNLFASDINGKPSLTDSNNLASYNFVLCFNNKS